MEKVAIIGSGNWGSVVCKIIGRAVGQLDGFDKEVRVWVYEEVVGTRNLSEIINTDHENIKYLPGIRLPENVRAYTELAEAVRGATLLVFVIPHQFVDNVCRQLEGRVEKGARGISLIKGMETGKGGGMSLISQVIAGHLGIDVCVLMGANLANEIAQEQFSESTIGYTNLANAQVFKRLFHTPYFRVSLVEDVCGVELCGALKNVVAVAAGFVDGLSLGENTKAAVIRIGLMEMKKFCKLFYAGIRDETFFESCGVADVITSCFGGRNRKVACAKVATGKSIDELEAEMLNGQKLQGPLTAKEIHDALVPKNLLKEFPLFTAVYRICYEGLAPQEFFLHL